jgi:type II secretory pathway pseudopilin PulG
MKRVGPVVWPGAVGLIVLIGLASGIAHAEDDQSDQDGNLIYEVLRSFGMTPKRTLEDQSGNHEQPPLVLPPPQASAAQDPNGPADPDPGRKAAKKRTTNRQDFDPDHFTDPLPLSELRGAAAGAANRSAGGDDMTDNMRPSQLGSPGGLFGSLFGAGNSNNAGEEEQVGALAWPADPDSGRQAAKKRTTNRQDFDPDHFTDPLPLSELRGAPAGAANRSVGDDDITDDMRPSQLGSPGGFFGSLFGAGNSNNARQEHQVGALASGQPRMRLVDPPAGYQTPSPSEPYGPASSANYGSSTKHTDPLGDDGR